MIGFVRGWLIVMAGLVLAACGGPAETVDSLLNPAKEPGSNVTSTTGEGSAPDFSGAYVTYGEVDRDTCSLGLDPYSNLPIDSRQWTVARKAGGGYSITIPGFGILGARTSGSHFTGENGIDTACGKATFRFAVNRQGGSLQGEYWATFTEATCGRSVPCGFSGNLVLEAIGEDD